MQQYNITFMIFMKLIYKSIQLMYFMVWFIRKVLRKLFQFIVYLYIYEKTVHGWCLNEEGKDYLTVSCCAYEYVY